MKLYLEMMKKPVFTITDVMEIYENEGSARTAVWRLQKEGLVEKIRNNMYTCVSQETGSVIANKYHIATAISPTSYVSHHSALEYYGVADQIYYEVYVSSQTKFNGFEFDGLTYHYLPSKFSDGVNEPAMTVGIRVTDEERTVIDSLKDMDKVSGIEEVVASVELMPKLDEVKLLLYLEKYNNRFLYQKAGYILSQYQKQFVLSDNFFGICKSKIGKSKRYLTKDCKCNYWVKEWNLIVPDNIFDIKNGSEIDEI